MKSGLNKILWGIGLIVIGFFTGGSVFTGNPEALDWIFDILGVGLILYGVYSILMSRSVE